MEGYRRCGGCEAFVVDLPSVPRLCDECRGVVGQAADGVQLVYEVEGQPYKAESAPRGPRKPYGKPRKPWEHVRAYDRARRRALRRLAIIYAPMFEVLLAEEKVREGLHPTATRRSLTAAPTSDLLDDLAEAAERQRQLGAGGD